MSFPQARSFRKQSQQSLLLSGQTWLVPYLVLHCEKEDLRSTKAELLSVRVFFSSASRVCYMVEPVGIFAFFVFHVLSEAVETVGRVQKEVSRK